jgi:hypothetical protein
MAFAGMPLNQPKVAGGSMAQADTDQFFNVFWASYPKKVGKAVCLTHWKRKLKPSAQMFREITDGLERWKKSDRWLRGYIMDPIRFLKERAWEDEMGEPGDLFTPGKPAGIPGAGTAPAPKGIRDKLRERMGDE